MNQSITMAINEQYVPLKVALQILGISRSTLNGLIQRGLITAVVLPGMQRRKIVAASLRTYLNSVP